MTSYVLDCWAMLEAVFGQPGAAKVQSYLEQADGGACRLLMSWINAGEAVYMTARKRGSEAAERLERAMVESFPIELCLPDSAAILRAARIQAASRLAYADAFAVELALANDAAIITGDPEIRAQGAARLIWVGPEPA